MRRSTGSRSGAISTRFVKRCRHTNNAGLIGAYYAFETEVEGMEKVPIR